MSRKQTVAANWRERCVAAGLLSTLLVLCFLAERAGASDRQEGSSKPSRDKLLAAILSEASQHLQVNWSTRLPIIRHTVAEKLPETPRTLKRMPLPGNDAAHGPFLEYTGDQLARKPTYFKVYYDDEALHVVVVCEEPDPSARLQIGKPHPGDRVGIWLDHDLDHRTFYNLWVMPDGRIQEQRHVVRQRGLERWEMGATGQHTLSEPADAVGATAEAVEFDRGWAVEVRIPFAGFGDAHAAPAKGTVWGFNVTRRSTPLPAMQSSWAAIYGYSDAPWAFGHLHFGKKSAVELQRVDLGEEVALWDNRGKITLHNTGADEREVEIRVSTATWRELRPYKSGSIRTKLGPHETKEVDFVYEFPRWHGSFLTLFLDVSAAGESPLKLRHDFGAGYGWPVCILWRPEDGTVENPKPDDPDFPARKLDYILSRLPRFERPAELGGMVLRARDGSVSFNLMEAGVLGRIARYIAGRYENDQDALLGLTYFVHQPAVVRYSHLTAPVSHVLNPLSVLRFGYGTCGRHSTALAGLAAELGYEAYYMNLKGHVVTSVVFEGRRVLLDGQIGRFYFMRDNRRLAGLEDLLADRELIDRAGDFLRPVFEDSPNLGRFLALPTVNWPQGAPIR